MWFTVIHLKNYCTWTYFNIFLKVFTVWEFTSTKPLNHQNNKYSQMLICAKSEENESEKSITAHMKWDTVWHCMKKNNFDFIHAPMLQWFPILWTHVSEGKVTKQRASTVFFNSILFQEILRCYLLFSVCSAVPFVCSAWCCLSSFCYTPTIQAPSGLFIAREFIKKIIFKRLLFSNKNLRKSYLKKLFSTRLIQMVQQGQTSFIRSLFMVMSKRRFLFLILCEPRKEKRKRAKKKNE